MPAGPKSRTVPVVAEKGWWKGLHPGMGIAATGMVTAFVVFTVLDVERAGAVFAGVRAWIEATLSGYYVATMGVTVLACLCLALGPFGRIRLGGDDARPEFTRFSWLSMLFSAGVGIGLLFFSISEPLLYFDNTGSQGYPDNPHADRAGAGALDAQRAAHALQVAYFHWGVHGWSVYAIVGLSLAYFGFRKQLPLTLRSALYPVLGERIHGPAGHLVDLLAVFGTIFGTATSLGLGVQQMASGLDALFGTDPGLTTQLVLVASISVAATASAVSGVGRGIRILSEWNIRLSLVLLGFFLVLGPFEWLLGFWAATVGDYLWNLVPMSLWTASDPGDSAWQSAWTLFYWGWWISWAPLVGLFIARISRGRTVREFMLGVLFVPSAISVLWIGLFGGSAIYLELNAAGGAGTAGLLDLVRAWNPEAALYATIARLSGIPWLTGAVSALATLLLATWFITSSDSGTLVITTLLSLGDEHPPRRFRIFWGLGQGGVAAVLLLAGGLQALQTASVAAALPVSVILLLATYGVIRALAKDPSAGYRGSG